MANVKNIFGFTSYFGLKFASFDENIFIHDKVPGICCRFGKCVVYLL